MRLVVVPPLFAMVAFAAMSIVHPGVAAAQSTAGLTIGDARWTHAVRDRQPISSLRKGERGRPLYLWVRLVGDQHALETLRVERKLPLRFQWSSHLVGVEMKELPDVAEGVPIDLDATGEFDRLALEVANRTIFDWRTWSMKRRVHKGVWFVRVTFADQTPLFCGGRPCEYRIVVD